MKIADIFPDFDKVKLGHEEQNTMKILNQDGVNYPITTMFLHMFFNIFLKLIYYRNQ